MVDRDVIVQGAEVQDIPPDLLLAAGVIFLTGAICGALIGFSIAAVLAAGGVK